jgi:hypothetical protein
MAPVHEQARGEIWQKLNDGAVLALTIIKKIYG